MWSLLLRNSWISFLVYSLFNQDSRCSHQKKGPFQKLSACVELHSHQKCHGHPNNRAETWSSLGTFQVFQWNANPLRWLGNSTDILPFVLSARAAKEKTESKPTLGFQLLSILVRKLYFLVTHFKKHPMLSLCNWNLSFQEAERNEIYNHCFSSVRLPA